MRKRITRHHIIPKSIGGTNHRDNITPLMNSQHRALHTVFGSDSPVDQIGYLVALGNTALTTEFKEDLIKLLSVEELDYFYQKHCFTK